MTISTTGPLVDELANNIQAKLNNQADLFQRHRLGPKLVTWSFLIVRLLLKVGLYDAVFL